MTQNIFLSYKQNVQLKFDIVDLKRLFVENSEVRIVLDVNKYVTETPYQRKETTIDPLKFDVLNYSFRHDFPIKEYSELEKNIIGHFWTLNIYVGGICKETRTKSVILCERKRFVERVISQKLNELGYRVKNVSGSNNPDLILSDPGCGSEIQCEITEKTNPELELSYEKFIEDVEKYNRYQRENRYKNVKHLLIIACANGVDSKIKKHIQSHSFDTVTVITYNDLLNLLYALKKGSIPNKEKIKTILNNPGIQKSPITYFRDIISPYSQKLTLAYTMDFRRPKSDWVGELDNKLLSIDDIEPFEVLKIIEIAKNHKDEYISKGKFKEILKSNILHIFKRRNKVDYSVIDNDAWLTTIIQLGYLDQYGKVTDKGLTLLEVFEKCRSEKSEELLRRIFGYDFLHAPGVAKFLKLVEKTYQNIEYTKGDQFIDELAKKMIDEGLSESRTGAKRACAGLFTWLKKLGYANEYGELIFNRIEKEWYA